MDIEKHQSDIELVRVCAMLMIILTHTIANYTFIPGSHVMGQLFNVGVEVFFAVSGYLYGNRKLDAYPIFMLKRAKRIWLPVLIVVVIDILFLICICADKPDIITTIAYILNLQGLLIINWELVSKIISEITNLGPLWFTTVIMICYGLLPLFNKVEKAMPIEANKRGYGGVVAAVSLCVFIIEIFSGTYLMYILCFWVGYLIRGVEYQKLSWSKTRALVYVVLIFGTCVARIVIRYFIDGTALYSTLVSFGHMIMGISIMLLFMELGKRFPAQFEKFATNKVIAYLDQQSFYIYLVHGIFCMGVTSVYARYNLAIASLVFLVATLISAQTLSMFVGTINMLIDTLVIKRKDN